MTDDVLGVSVHVDLGDAEKSFEKLCKSLEQAGMITADVANQMQAALAQLGKTTDAAISKQAINSLEDFVTKLEDAKKNSEQSVGAVEKTISSLGEQYDKLNEQRKQFSESSDEYKKLDKELTNVCAQLNVQQDLFNKLSLETELYAKTIDVARSALDGYSNNGGKLAGSLAEIKAQNAEMEKLIDAFDNGTISLDEFDEGLKKIYHTITTIQGGAEKIIENLPFYSEGYVPQYNEQGKAIKDDEGNTVVDEKATADYKNQQRELQEYNNAVEEAIEKHRALSESAKEIAHEEEIEHWKEVVDSLKTKLEELNAEKDEIKKALDMPFDALVELFAKISDGPNLQQFTAIKEEVKELSAQLKDAEQKLKAAENGASGLSEEAQKGKPLFVGWYDAIANFKDKTVDTFKTIVKPVTDFGHSIKEHVKSGLDSAKNAISEFRASVEEKLGIEEVAHRIGEHFDSIKEKAVGLKDSLKDWATGNGKLQEGFAAFKDSLSELPLPMGNVIGSVKNMGKALMTMIATPVGAFLAAIVIALKAVFTWFNKSADGQKAFAKISAYVGSVLESLTDILVKVGEYLFHAFADANGPLNDFARGLVVTLKSAVRTASNLLGGLGDMIHGVWEYFTGDKDVAKDLMSRGWESVKQGFSGALETVQNVYKTSLAGMKGLVSVGQKAVSTLFSTNVEALLSKINSDALTSAANAKEEQDIIKETSELRGKTRETEGDIEKIRKEMLSLSEKEKQEKIKEIADKTKESYDAQLKLMQRKLNLTHRQNELHGQTLESLASERALQSEIYKLEAQRNAKLRSVEAMRVKSEKAEEQQAKREQKAAERAEKAAQRQAKAAERKAKQDQKQQVRVEKAQFDLDETIYEHANERAEVRQSLNAKVRETTIAAMPEGEKASAQKAYNQEKELIELQKERDKLLDDERERQIKEFQKAQKVVEESGGKPRQMTEDDFTQDEFNQIKKAYEEIENKTRERQRNEEIKKQKDAYRALLKEYGDYEEKRLAIAEEYAEKIAKAETSSDVAVLMAQRDEKTKALEKKQFEETINWSGVFSDLKGHTKEYLHGLASQLQSVINQGTLQPEQLATVQAKLRDINAEISKQGGLFDFVGDRKRERTRRNEEANAAEDALDVARQNESKAEQDVSNKEVVIRSFLQMLGKDSAMDLSDENITKTFADGSKEQTTFIKMLSELKYAEINLTKARKKTKEATDSAAKAADAAKTNSAQAIAEWFADTQQFIKQKGIDQIPDLLNEVGLGGAGEKAQQGLDMFNNAAGAAADFASGNYVGAALKGIKAIGNLGNMLGIGGSSDKSLNDDIERLSATNEALRRAVENLTDELSDSSVSEAAEIYGKMVKDIRDSERNTRDLMRRSGAVYDSGTFGIFGGKSSSNKAIDTSVSSAEWARVSRYAGVSVTSAAQFWSLTSKQMSDVAKEAPEVYSHIKQLADDGYGDAATFMDQYIEYWRQLEQAESSYYEKLTSTSFDSVLSQFTSTLMDMDSSAYEFANNFEEYMQSAVINSLVSEKYKPLLEKWYKELGDAMADGDMSVVESEKLKRDWDSIVEQATEMREVMRERFAWGSTGEGSGAYKAATSFSQEQGDELNGRLTAIQIGQEKSFAQREQIIALQMQQSAELHLFTLNTQSLAADVEAMRDIQYNSLRRLTEIRDYTAVLPEMASDIRSMQQDIHTKL